MILPFDPVATRQMYLEILRELKNAGGPDLAGVPELPSESSCKQYDRDLRDRLEEYLLQHPRVGSVRIERLNGQHHSWKKPLSRVVPALCLCMITPAGERVPSVKEQEKDRMASVSFESRPGEAIARAAVRFFQGPDARASLSRYAVQVLGQRVHEDEHDREFRTRQDALDFLTRVQQCAAGDTASTFVLTLPRHQELLSGEALRTLERIGENACERDHGGDLGNTYMPDWVYSPQQADDTEAEDLLVFQQVVNQALLWFLQRHCPLDWVSYWEEQTHTCHGTHWTTP